MFKQLEEHNDWSKSFYAYMQAVRGHGAAKLCSPRLIVHAWFQICVMATEGVDSAAAAEIMSRVATHKSKLKLGGGCPHATHAGQGSVQLTFVLRKQARSCPSTSLCTAGQTGLRSTTPSSSPPSR